MSPPAAATSPGRTAAPGTARPHVVPRRPRRVSGPAPRPRHVRPASVPLGARALGAARALPDHKLLDRLLRGRTWIVLVGAALIGIVYMQVSLLKLNAGIGRAVERSALLQRENDLLRVSNSRQADGQRLQRTAERNGLVAPSPGSVRFVSPRATSAERAARALASPRTAIPVTTLSPSGPAPSASSTTTTTTATPAAPVTPAATGTATTPAAAPPPAAAPTAATSPSPAAAAPATGTAPAG